MKKWTIFQIYISRGSEVPAPDSLLPNKLKVLLKSKSMKMSAKCEQKNTSVGKLFSRNKSRVKSLSPSKLINTTLDENPIRQHSLPNEGIYICTYILNIISWICVSKIVIIMFL